MKNITFKWSIFVFFLLFGLAPLAVISYITLISYTRSVTAMTDRHTVELIEKTGAQIENQCYNYLKFLDILSKTPYVQLSFLQYPYAGQRQTVNDKLDVFRHNTKAFSRLTLFSNEGQIVASTPKAGQRAFWDDLDREKVNRIKNFNYYHAVDLNIETGVVAFFKTVFDFQNPERTVGLVCGEVPLKELTDLVKNMGLSEGAENTITNGQDQVLFRTPPSEHSSETDLRRYSADLPLLNWRITARLPEAVLYRDVDAVRRKIMIIAGLVAVVAGLAVLFFSRLLSKPLNIIIEGAREFASGNLEHRIDVPWGAETRRVAKAFNDMAKQLADRQAELAQAGKLASLGILSAGFAHEVRNPLAGIKTSAQVLERLGVGTRDRTLARGISKEVDRLNKIVEDLLQFSKPKEPNRTHCDLRDAAEHSLDLLEARIRRKQATVVNNVTPLTVTADKDQIIQVLINLLLNALQVMDKEKGTITIESGLTQEGNPYLSVGDNGSGVPPELLPRIFDPFFSLSREGTGLGLSIVQTLLRQNGARLEVDSPPGGGAVFSIIFKEQYQEPLETEHGRNRIG